MKNAEHKNNVIFSIFHFGGIPSDLLEAQAQSVICPKYRRIGGRSRERNDSHYAGRCAAAALLDWSGVSAKIVPDAEWGYLTLCDANLRPFSGLYLNISHTRDVAVAVLAEFPVGIDIEACERDVSRVMQRVASPRERLLAEKYRGEDPKFPAHVALWSAKEAFSKALGLGMNFGLQQFEIPLAGEPPFSVFTEGTGPMALREPAVSFSIQGNFLVSVCTEKEKLKLGLQCLTVDRALFNSLRRE